MKKWLLLSLLLPLLLCGCQKDADQVPELLEPVGIQFDTAYVKRGELLEMETLDFSLVPYTQELFFSCDGVVEEICVAIGDEVTKGQALIRLDVETEEKRIAEIDKTLAYNEKNNEYTLRLMQMDIDLCKYQMENRDYKEGGEREQLKENDLDRLESTYKQEQERQNLEKTQLEQEKQTLQAVVDASVLTAPFDGLVAYLPELYNGSTVRNAQTLCVVADPSLLKLRGAFVGQSSIETAAGMYALIGGERCEITYEPMEEAEYLSLLLSGEEMNTTFTLDNGVPDGARMGDYACVVLVTKQLNDVLSVPINCLYHDATGNYVYVKDEAGRTRVDVTVGVRTTTAAEIREGLAEGDEVYVKE